MKSLNKVVILGHVGQEPEIRYSAAGSAVVNVSVATTYKYKDTESTSWHRIVAFSKLAELIGQYLHKGSPVYFEGRLQYREYEQDGVKKYSTEIVASEMILLGSKGSAQGSRPEADPVPSGNAKDDFHDDIPF